MNITFPPLFRIDLKEADNIIRQLYAPAWTEEGNIAPLFHKRVEGYIITSESHNEPVYIIKNSAKPDADWQKVIKANRSIIVDDTTSELNLRDAQWIKHPSFPGNFASIEEYEANANNTRYSWLGTFRYKREDKANNILGLRPPQIGAIYATQAHWTVDNDLATIVLPTGVGKTETMLSIMVAEQCPRLLVVVPTDALRTQIANKFFSFGLLKTPRFEVIDENAIYPVVGILNRRPTTVEEVDSLFRKCNVVITTMPLAGQCSPEVMQRMAELCPCLFIDEAHHVAAPTWRDFKIAFDNSRIIQFTATPFRNDDLPIGGRRIFTFSLKRAQEQEYFKPIDFKPVIEWDPAKRDSSLAKAAVEQLRKDFHLGHILMARVGTVARAQEVFEFYREYTEFEPVQIHTGIKSKAERDEIRQKLLSGKSRIVVCVDMLGEGFDLPELKIAALHDIRKSLSVTLQLIGRFTRTKPNLGNATVITNIADQEVKNELRRLYQHDSDWNALLPQINDNVNEGDFNLGEYLNGFQNLPDDITLQNVRPAMSAVAYHTKCTDWTPDDFAKGIAGYSDLDKVYHTLNAEERTLVIVTTRRVSVDWAQIDEIHNWDWQLYILHWAKEDNLLFIHNSANAGFYKPLAKAVAGNDVIQVSGPKIFRCLANINRLKLQNVGLLEQLGRLVRYTMRAGSDVEPALSESQKQRAKKANIFGQGFENGSRSSIGCSYKGRIWSYQTTNLLKFTNWCRAVGKRLIDETLDPEDVLKGTLVVEIVSTRPLKVPIAIEWPDVIYKEPERAFCFNINDTVVYLHDTDIDLVDPDVTGTLRFRVSSNDAVATFEIEFIQTEGHPDFQIRLLDATTATIRYHGHEITLVEFFQEEPPTFWFADGTSLSGIEYTPLPKKPEPFSRERIETWDWSGTSIRTESQGIKRDKSSIQYRVIQELMQRNFTVIYDDDDKGESADVVGIIEEANSVEIEFWHCKFSGADEPGHRIKDMYELCGQAQKSVRWMDKKYDLFTHLLRREPRKYKGEEDTRYQTGTKQDLLRIRNKVEIQPVNLKIFIVQPGLSKKEASLEQLELLAVTENYLLQTFIVPLTVIGND